MMAASMPTRMLRALIALEDGAQAHGFWRRIHMAEARHAARSYDREIVDWYDADRLPAIGTAAWDAYLNNVARAASEHADA